MNDVCDTAIGFIGMGGIATALAKGFCGAEAFSGKVYMYDPNPERTGTMKKLYPDKIIVAKSNQELIDAAEVIFPALLPDILRQTAPPLKFRKENRVIHIAAGIKLAEAEQWFKPAQSVVRSVPLPFTARRFGPVALFGKDEYVRELLGLVGFVVETDTEKDLEVLAVITGMMVSFHALAGETIKWGVSKGVEFHNALKYVTSMNEALSILMRLDCDKDIEAFLLENTTPHGTNEMGLKMMRDADAYHTWLEALEKIGKRYGL
jgi:pyrroline-5-carboxylate reductase